MEKGMQVMGNGVSGEKAVKKKNLTLYPVEPNSLSKGLPYAPQIGRILAILGTGGSARGWLHLVSIETGACIFRSVSRAYDDFHPYLLLKVPLVASKRNKEAPWSSKMTKKARPAMSQAFPSISDGSEYSKCGSEPHIDLEDVAPDQSIGSSCYASKDFLRNVQEPHAQFCEEDVDDFLKFVEHILSQHNDEAQVWTPSTCAGSDMAEEMSTLFLLFLPWISHACCPGADHFFGGEARGQSHLDRRSTA
ncbi:hypothetical protein NL676_020960 [Syzygium grande]|nr:hypothetical protein NL676_020960 [Syzygium grande]